jgi:broad specificity phosphatase PhoE
VLILIRHGRTAINAGGRLQGRADHPLDDVGSIQAAQVAQAIGPVDVLISSPLLRARQTADAFGQEYTVDERWQEVDYGEYEGKPLHEVSAAEWEVWRTDRHYTAPGGESLAALDVRVRAACDDLVALASNQMVAVVSHVSPIKAAVAWALDVDVMVSWRCRLDQAAVCRIDVKGARRSMCSFNEVLHNR